MKKYFKQLKNQKGMTLVELLAVLVILGIIAAIAVPMIGNTIEDSEKKAAINDALNIISAAKLADANNEPEATDGGYTETQLNDYLDSTSVFDKVVKNADGTWKIVGHDDALAHITESVTDELTETELKTNLEN